MLKNLTKVGDITTKGFSGVADLTNKGIAGMGDLTKSLTKNAAGKEGDKSDIDKTNNKSILSTLNEVEKIDHVEKLVNLMFIEDHD